MLRDTACLPPHAHNVSTLSCRIDLETNTVWLVRKWTVMRTARTTLPSARELHLEALQRRLRRIPNKRMDNVEKDERLKF